MEENKQAGAGRDGRIRLARPIFRREQRQGNIVFSSSFDNEQESQPYIIDLYSAMCDVHTFKVDEILSIFLPISIHDTVSAPANPVGA